MAYFVDDIAVGRLPAATKAPVYKAYINNVYGGLVSDKPEVQKAVADQYDYNKRRLLAGKEPLRIADVSWKPDGYDDEMNEWIAERYQKTGKLPSGAEQLDYMQQAEAEKRKAAGLAGLMAHSTNNPNTIAGGLSQLRGNERTGMENAAYPQQPAQSDATQEPDSFNPLELANNPYKELAKIAPEGALRNVLDAIGTGYQHLPSTLIRDHVLPLPRVLAQNGFKALSDATKGKEVHYDPNITGIDVMDSQAEGGDPSKLSPEQLMGVNLRQAQVMQPADLLKWQLSNPLGRTIYGLLADVSLDPLTYLGPGVVSKIANAAKVLNGSRTASQAASGIDDIANAAHAATKADDAAALEAKLAQQAKQGYTQGGRAAAEALDDGAAAVREGTQGARKTKLYRVMSDAEHQSIINNGGKFSIYDRAMEEKWFATSPEDAAKWAEKFYPDGQYKMIEIEVPTDSLNQLYQVGKLDGIGPAYSGGIDFLNSIMKELKLR